LLLAPIPSFAGAAQPQDEIRLLFCRHDAQFPVFFSCPFVLNSFLVLKIGG